MNVIIIIIIIIIIFIFIVIFIIIVVVVVIISMIVITLSAALPSLNLLQTHEQLSVESSKSLLIIINLIAIISCGCCRHPILI